MNTEQNTKPALQTQDEEIDLIAIAKTLWKGRKTIIKMTLIFMLIGLFIAIFSAKEYTASTTLVPQNSSESKISGSLGSLAALAGINLGGVSGNSGIPPTLYPKILNSITFQKKLLKTPLTIVEQSEKVTLENYYLNIFNPGLFSYLKKYTIGLPGIIIKAFKETPKMGISKESLITFTEDEQDLFDLLNEQISLEINDTDGYISITANMPEPIAAAEMAERVKNLLQQFLLNFKTQKSTEQLNFIQERFIEKEKEFNTIQQKLARFQDRNQNVQTAQSKTILQNLESQYDLIFGVYSELAKQLEAQKFQVKQDTPVFTVINPVSIPIQKSAPNRPFILIIWIFLGGIVGIGVLLVKEVINIILKKWNEGATF